MYLIITAASLTMTRHYKPLSHKCVWGEGGVGGSGGRGEKTGAEKDG